MLIGKQLHINNVAMRKPTTFHQKVTRIFHLLKRNIYDLQFFSVSCVRITGEKPLHVPSSVSSTISFYPHLLSKNVLSSILLNSGLRTVTRGCVWKQVYSGITVILYFAKNCWLSSAVCPSLFLKWKIHIQNHFHI